MNQHINCQIIPVGKRRDGGMRYWCIEHKADATAKYGKPAAQCRYAHIPSITEAEILDLNLQNYQGGVALWGAVPPVYDTTQQSLDRGIHVHARRTIGGEKEIDGTYRAVRLIEDHKRSSKEGIFVPELEAIYYLVSSTFGYSMKYVECSLCHFPHLDKDWFSVHAHQRHLCAGCGQYFRDTEVAVGNPIIKIQKIFDNAGRFAKQAAKSINIRQSEYPEGIRIWGSNLAILWTGAHQEEEGIHVHASGKAKIDDTFFKVTIDDIHLDPAMVQVLMAQNVLPHIAGRVTNIQCPKCDEPHFDTGELAFTPHEEHSCDKCGLEFRSKGRIRKVIGNPMVGILDQLAKTAPRSPQKHEVGLIPETL